MPRRIIVIDDEEEMCWVLSRAIAREGFQVITFTDPRRGLESFTHKGADLLLMDLVMPGMDGITLLKHIRAINKQVPVVVITGFGSLENAIELMRAGATAYLIKPFNLKDVRKVVRRVLNGEGCD